MTSQNIIMLFIIAIVSPIVLLGSCSNEAEESGKNSTSPNGKLVLTGSSTVAPLALEIGKRFEESHPDVRIDVQTGGSTRGISNVREGIADIGMVSRALKDEERDIIGFPLALDGVCVILNKENPVKELSDQQIIDIYTGKITNWSEVGGNNSTITVVNKAEGRATLELFLNYFKLRNSDIHAQVIIGDNEHGIKTVAGDPNSIGYVSIGTAEYDEANDVPIKLLPIAGITASLANVQNGSFPLSRPLNLVTGDKPDGLTKAFIEYAQSENVHDIIKEQYFVPLQPR